MKAIKYIVLLLLTSFFYFPFNPSIAPPLNTKMVVSAIGLLWFVVKCVQRRHVSFGVSLFSVSVVSLLVSAIGLCSVFINNTEDYTYASYIISAWVWIGGAYAVVEYARLSFGSVSLRVITNALACVCVIQCVLSQIIATNVHVAEWADSLMVSTGFMGKADGRLYGIGCALDVAGLKFSCVLLLLAHFAAHPSGRINERLENFLYIIAYVIISVFGSMISRTTSVGMLLSIFYWLILFIFNRNDEYSTIRKISLETFLIILVVAIPLFSYEYSHNSNFYNNIRFGFEGFFSLFETGQWQVRSNEQLHGMWVWPDNVKTWCIGDGYFERHVNDMNYIGPNESFYMGTDIGYCRFIFYFGIVGLAVFAFHFINCFLNCAKNIPTCRFVFFLLLCVNFIGWIKVSSDIFPIFALILVLGEEQTGKKTSLSINS